MATASTLSIYNRALASIGARSQISSLNEASTEADAASLWFTPVYESLARTANWNCLRFQQNLTLLAAAQGTPENPNGTTLPLPPVPWLYQYLYPANCLQMRFLAPSLPSPTTGVPLFSTPTGAQTWIPNDGQIPYVVAYNVDINNNPLNVVLTNQSQAIAVYTINQPNPQVWDSLFQEAMVASLAAYFVPTLSMNAALLQSSIATAERLIEQARVRDGNEQPVSQDHQPDWMRARAGASGMYWRNGRNNATGWGCMTWPSY